MDNIITATFGNAKSVYTRGLHQWDYGQVLKFADIDLPDTYTVHFANQPMSGTAKTMIGGVDGVEIPDEYLATGINVYAWVFLHTGNTDGETAYMVTIPVSRRPRPIEDEPTPVQRGLIETALEALDAGVEAAESAADEAQDIVDNIEQTIASAVTVSVVGENLIFQTIGGNNNG